MVNKLRNPARENSFCLGRVAGRATIVATICLSLAAILPAQTGIGPDCPQGVATPGAIGSQQLQRGGPLLGYFQSVEIRAPRGATVSAAIEGNFEQSRPTPHSVGILIGPVYRFRIMNIPLAPGVEVFPTIEVVDRVYAPQGQEVRFAIPVEITSEELQLAASGKFVTRVIYIEDPHSAVPVAQNDQQQSWFDVGPGKNPLAVARNLGRPVAILRMGGRLPDNNPEDLMQFLCGCPPLMHFETPDSPTQAPITPPIKQQPVEQQPAEQAQPEQGLQRPPWFDSFIATRPTHPALPSQQTPVVSQPVAETPVVNKPAVSQPAAVRSESTGVRKLPPPPRAKKSSIR